MEVNGRSGGEGATEEEQHRSAAVIEERLDPIIRILKQQCEYEVLSHPRPDDENAISPGFLLWSVYTASFGVAKIYTVHDNDNVRTLQYV
nr:hypothetical protein BaRGS_009485 [Batillaria attramentaria]